jgi:hypothetical protein
VQIAGMLAEYSEDELLARLEGDGPPPSALHHRLAGLIPVSQSLSATSRL